MKRSRRALTALCLWAPWALSACGGATGGDGKSSAVDATALVPDGGGSGGADTGVLAPDRGVTPADTAVDLATPPIDAVTSVPGDALARDAIPDVPSPDARPQDAALAPDVAPLPDAAPTPDALPPDRTPPEVAFTAPADGAAVDGVVSVSATATDDRGVTSVGFLVDGAASAMSVAAPFGFDWDTSALPVGRYTLTAIAQDAAGNEAQAFVEVRHAVGCNADGDCPPSDLRLITPADGATVCGLLTLEAATAAADVVGVAFSVDGQPLSSDQTPPFTAAWDTVGLADGRHTLTAVATDAAGLAAQSSVVVDVQNHRAAGCDNLPSVRILTPTVAASLTGLVDVGAEASDDQGVDRVVFYVDNARISSDDAVPFGFTWNTGIFFEGVHTLKATAYDTQNQVASAQIPVTIDRTPPVLAVRSPLAGALVHDTLSFDVDASDRLSDFDVRVALDFRGAPVDGPGLVSTTLDHAPFVGDLDLSDLPAAEYDLHVLATDRAGNTSTVTTPVRLDRLPVIDLYSPANGDIVTGTTRVRFTTSDDRGLPTVRFLVDGQNLGAVDAASGGVDWIPAYAMAPHTLVLEVTDASGQVARDQVVVQVDHLLEVTLSICLPNGCLPDDATVTGEAVLRAATRDDDGQVQRVEFGVDGTLLGTDETAPFAITLDTTTLTDGRHAFWAHAISSNTSEATSDRSVIIDNCDVDGDGFIAVGACGGDDCDDLRRDVRPGAFPDLPNGIDDDCDGLEGEDAPVGDAGVSLDAAVPADAAVVDAAVPDAAVDPYSPVLGGRIVTEALVSVPEPRCQDLTGDGVPDNAFSGLGSLANDQIQGGIDAGTRNTLLISLGLAIATPPSGRFALGFANGVPDGAGGYTIDPSGIGPDGHPLNVFDPAQCVAGAVQAGPAIVTYDLTLNGTAMLLPLQHAEMTGDIALSANGLAFSAGILSGYVTGPDMAQAISHLPPNVAALMPFFLQPDLDMNGDRTPDAYSMCVTFTAAPVAAHP